MGPRCRPLSTFQCAAGGCPGTYIIPLLPLTRNTFLNRFSYSLWYKSTKDSADPRPSSCFGIRGRPLYALPVGFREDVEDRCSYAGAFLLAEGERDDLIVRAESDDMGVVGSPLLSSHRFPLVVKMGRASL